MPHMFFEHPKKRPRPRAALPRLCLVIPPFYFPRGNFFTLNPPRFVLFLPWAIPRAKNSRFFITSTFLLQLFSIHHTMRLFYSRERANILLPIVPRIENKILSA
jgi:hypothetical protein